MMTMDNQYSAAALYDGGWRAEDAEDLKNEYQFSQDELDSLVEELKAIEDANRMRGGKTMKKYQVIGGQYESHYYGESDSLHGAKIIAGRNKEYWDNWQGWHKPKIYRAKDVVVIESNGRIIRIPVDGAMPIGD